MTATVVGKTTGTTKLKPLGFTCVFFSLVFPGLQAGRSEVCRSTFRQLWTNRSGRGLFRPHRPLPVQQDGGAARPSSACRHTIQAGLIRSRPFILPQDNG